MNLSYTHTLTAPKSELKPLLQHRSGKPKRTTLAHSQHAQEGGLTRSAPLWGISMNDKSHTQLFKSARRLSKTPPSEAKENCSCARTIRRILELRHLVQHAALGSQERREVQFHAIAKFRRKFKTTPFGEARTKGKRTQSARSEWRTNGFYNAALGSQNELQQQSAPHPENALNNCSGRETENGRRQLRTRANALQHRSGRQGISDSCAQAQPKKEVKALSATLAAPLCS